MSNKKVELELLSCPGDVIVEILDEKKLTKQWLAQQLGISGNGAWKLMKGNTYITLELAHRLESIFKVNFQYWLNRDKNYRDKLARIKRL